jgi:hypothetical protein
MMKEGLTFNYPVIRRFPQRVLCRVVLLLSRQITRYLQMQLISVVPSTAVVPVYIFQY